MNFNKPLQNILFDWSPFVVIIVTTLAFIAISIYYLSSGVFIIFQNIFYIPIIIACMYYTKRGFAFSIIIACIYFFLIIGFTRESSILLEAFVRVLIFVGVAGVTTFLSIKRKYAEDRLSESEVRKRAEAAIALNAQRMKALLQLNQMIDLPMQEITDFVLEEAVRLTQSTIGYLAFLNEDESVLTMHSWSKSAMAQCAIQDKPILYPVETTGLWGEAVRQRQAVITNDYNAPNPLKKSYPEGHVSVWRHMNTPIFDGKRIVIIAGVGNKSEDYDQGDLQQLTLLMEGMWRLLERKQADDALKENKSILVQTAEIGKVGGWEFDIGTGKQIWTKTVYDIHEVNINTYKPTVDKGISFYTPASRPIIDMALKRAIEQNEPFDVELEIITARGNLRSVHAIGKVDQARRKVVGFFQDITEHKRVEESLRDSEERFRRMFQDSAIGMVIVSPDFYFLQANDAFCKMMGYTATELLEKTFQDLTLPEDRPVGGDLVRRVLSGDMKTFDLEKRYQHKDGTVIFGKISATLIRDAKNNPLHFFAHIQDITYRKQAEEKILKLNETLEQRIIERTAELRKTIDLLEETNRAFVGRELRMAELKEQIAELEKKKRNETH